MNEVARHLAHALEQHRRWCRDQAIPVPVELEQLVRIVSGGQERTTSPHNLDLPDDAGVPIALEFHDAGRLLGGVSAKTVSRLVQRGELHAITIGAAKRIPRSELERIIADQLAPQVAS